MFFTLFILIFNQACYTRQAQKSVSVQAPKDNLNETQLIETNFVDFTVNNNYGKDTIYPKIIKNRYNIAVALPFELNEIYNEDDKQSVQSRISQDFYSGMLTYLDEFKNSDLNFTLEVFVFDIAVYDTLNNSFFDKLKQNQIDILIGPFKKEHLNQLKKFSIENKMTVISPFNCDELQLSENPYYISLKSSESKIAELLAEHASVYFPNNNIILLGSSKAELDNAIQIFNKKVNVSGFHGFNSYVVNSANWSNNAYLSTLKDSNNLILCLIKNDLVAINSILTNLSPLTSKKFSLLVPFDWLHYNAVETSALSALNCHFFTEPNIDYKDSSNFSFINTYREKYKTEPNDFAYRAYNLTKLIVNSLSEEGVYIQRGFNKSGSMYLKSEDAMGFENAVLDFYYFKENTLLKFNRSFF